MMLQTIHPQFPNMMTEIRQSQVTQMISNMYSVNPGAARSSPALFKVLVAASYLGRPDVSRMYSATIEGIERMVHARRERRLMRRVKRMKMPLTVAVPIWRLLRLAVLAFARSFFAFCAIVLVVREGLGKLEEVLLVVSLKRR